MRRLLLSICLIAAACSDPTSGEHVGRAQSDITNGVADTTHHAVVMVYGAGNSACSGTIIHTNLNDGVGHAITAAHCGDGIYVIQGNDYDAPDAVYNVTSSQNHPSYDGNTYDFKMVRFTSVSSATPIIPAMTPAQDNLQVGTPVIHVGYGKAGPPPGTANSVRRSIGGTLSDVNTATIEYNQPGGGPCSGDSGGPQLSSNGALVVGVTSNGDPGCDSYGESGRISQVYNSFVVPFINQPVAPLNCSGCLDVVTAGQGACMPEVNACQAHGECSALLDCYQGCSSAACYQQCDDAHPSGVPVYTNIFTCVCNVGCAAECESSSICDENSSTAVAAAAGAGATAAATGVGGGDPGATGVGGAGIGGDTGWEAGELGAEEHDGEVVSSGACSIGEASSLGGPLRGAARPPVSAWLLSSWLLYAAIACLRRRRDRI